MKPEDITGLPYHTLRNITGALLPNSNHASAAVRGFITAITMKPLTKNQLLANPADFMLTGYIARIAEIESPGEWEFGWHCIDIYDEQTCLTLIGDQQTYENAKANGYIPGDEGNKYHVYFNLALPKPKPTPEATCTQ